MRAAQVTGMELVAICDTWEEKLFNEGEQLQVSSYTDYEEFLNHDMDAVVLANYFHEHAPFAIRALKADKHVMSETSACHTLGEGVALARAAPTYEAGAHAPRRRREADVLDDIRVVKLRQHLHLRGEFFEHRVELLLILLLNLHRFQLLHHHRRQLKSMKLLKLLLNYLRLHLFY